MITSINRVKYQLYLMSYCWIKKIHEFYNMLYKFILFYVMLYLSTYMLLSKVPTDKM